MADERDVYGEYAQFQQRAAELCSEAARAAGEVAEAYTGDLYAAGGSDDPATRARAAWARYQLGLAQVSRNYWRSMSAQRREFANWCEDVAEQQMATSYQHYHDQMEAMLATASSDAPDRPKAAAPRRSRRGTNNG